MDHESVMIETQSGADVPVAEMNLILHVGGRLDIPAAIGELKLLLSIGIELRRIRDGVAQRFVDRREERVDSGFPVVAAVVAGQIGARVTFAIAAILRDDHGSGQRIGSEIGARHRARCRTN